MRNVEVSPNNGERREVWKWVATSLGGIVLAGAAMLVREDYISRKTEVRLAAIDEAVRGLTETIKRTNDIMRLFGLTEDEVQRRMDSERRSKVEPEEN